MIKFNKIAIAALLAMAFMSTAAFADSVSFTSIPLVSNVNIASDGTGGTTFTFGPAAVSGATPLTDSLNFFANNLFAIGGGVVLHSNGTFSPDSTGLQIGSSPNSQTGELTGSIQFITISQTSGSPGAYAINIGVTSLNYSCGAGCVSSTVLSELANGGFGNLTFTFGFQNGPQTESDMLNYGFNAAGTNANSRGFTGTVDTVPEPASLALLGSGLLAGGNFVRRKLKR